MTINIIDIGFGSTVKADEIIAIVAPDSAPIKRLISQAKEENRLTDATNSRSVRAVILTRSHHIILSGIAPATLGDRFVVEKLLGDQSELPVELTNVV